MSVGRCGVALAPIGALFSMLALTACISAPLASTVVDYNLAVEKAQNEMLLLNVVRAAKWKPLYLTDLSSINGSLKLDLSGTLAVPFGPSGTNNAAGVSGTYSVNPTYSVAVLNSQEFMQGFLRPVTADQIGYFLDQNWSSELLLHLFVLEVEYEENGEIKTRKNHPRWNVDEDLEFGEFSAWVTRFGSRKPRLVSCKPEETTLGSSLSLKEAALLKTAAATDAQEVSLLKKGDTLFDVRVVRKPGRPVLVAGTVPEGPACSANNRNDEWPLEAHLQGLECVAGSACSPVTFHLRSPESIIYYLGQVVRMGILKGLFPQVVSSLGAMPLFVALRGDVDETCGEPGISVIDSDKDTFWIPKLPFSPGTTKREQGLKGSNMESHMSAERPCYNPGFSTDALTILTQLIALHKTAKEPPGTQVVRAIVQ